MNRLKFLREEKGLLQEDVGKILEVSGRAIGNYENEKRDIPTEYVVKLANFFNVSTDYLLGKSDVRNFESKNEDILDLAKVGFTKDNYNPPTDKQKEQIKTIIETILQDNKKDNKENDENK